MGPGSPICTLRFETGSLPESASVWACQAREGSWTRWKSRAQWAAERPSLFGSGVARMVDVNWLDVRSRSDTERAQRTARAMAHSLGLSSVDAESVALAATELATNLVRYGIHGQLRFVQIEDPRGVGVEIESRD